MMCRRLIAALGAWLVLAVAAVAAEPGLKALIVDGQNGHKCWPETTKMIKAQLEETGLFKVDVATAPAKGKDMSGFKPEFCDYDVVISNYQGDEWPEETKKAILDYVKGGGGLVIYHFACAAFPKWEAWNRMIGLGGWGGRNEKHGPYVRWKDGKMVLDNSPGRGGGHGPSQEFALDVRCPDHPIMKGLPARFAHVEDELYGWLRGPAENLTVLATAFAPKSKGGSDEHEPLLFTVKYGEGRVFQNALGHSPEQLKSVAFIVTMQRGCEWAATGKVTQKVPGDFPGADKPSVRE